MLLPLAEERRNVITLAHSLGYETKPTTPAYVDVTIRQVVDATAEDNPGPDYDTLGTAIIPRNTKITSTSDSKIVFETLSEADFNVSGSAAYYEPSMSAFDNSTGLATQFTLTRKVKALSGETKTTTFTVGSPEKFLQLTLADTNVIEIKNVEDTNGNTWHKVDYLAQDKVPKELFYDDDDIRGTAYSEINPGDGADVVIEVPVPYTLEYIQTTKRFITRMNDDNTTSLIFGNGLLRTGATGSAMEGFLSTEQVGILNTTPFELVIKH